jgi:hypothetical protein
LRCLTEEFVFEISARRIFDAATPGARTTFARLRA